MDEYRGMSDAQLTKELDDAVRQRAMLEAKCQELEQRLDKERAIRRRAEDKLRRVGQELRQTQNELEKFSFIIFNDLKAPVQSLNLLAVKLFQEHAPAMDTEGRSYLDLFCDQVAKLQELVEGLIKYSRLSWEAPKKESVQSEEVVKKVVDSILPDPAVPVIVESPLPPVECDKEMLEQQLLNLINSALKHAGQSEGEIKVSCTDIGEYWEFCVQDSGKGFDKARLGRAFEMIPSLETQNQPESTDVELYLVKRITERQGGSVRAESIMGQGTSFYFSVPKQGSPIVS